MATSASWMPTVLNGPTLTAPPHLQATNSLSPPYAPDAAQNDFNSLYVASDAICLQAYGELKTKAPNPLVQSPVLFEPQGMGIGHLFAVAVTRNAVEQVEKIIASPGMQNLLEPTSTFNPHLLSINDTAGNWFSLPRWASVNASVEMLRCIFTPQTAGLKVFDVNAVDWFGFTTLESALQLQAPSQVPKIEYLLDHPDIQTSILKPSTLQYAIEFCEIGNGVDESLVEKFLEKGANIDLTGCSYGTYFEAACFFSSTALIHKLISKSTSKVTTLNNGGAKYGSFLQAAACLGRLDVVQHLLTLDEVDVNQTGGIYGSALAAAAKAGWRDIRDPYTADPKTRWRWGAFITVHGPEDVSQAYLEIVKTLIKHGAIVSRGEGIFYNSIGAAVYSSYPPIVELLLQNDNDSEIEQQRRHSEAVTAAAFQQESANASSILELLMTSGHGNPNRYSEWMKGIYPLELAVLFRNLAHVRFLLDHGADPHLEGIGGPLRVAILQTQQQGPEMASTTAKLILSHMNLKSPSLTARDSQYCNILHMAVLYGLIDVVQILLANDVRCDVKDLGQRTVLHIATLQGNTAMIKLLLESGRLDDELIEAEDAWGRTASQIVEEESRKAREVADKSRSTFSTYVHNHQVNQIAMQWSEIRRIMKPLEDKALADQENLHNRGVRFLGPKANVLQQFKAPTAKPVTTILPRGSGLGFQATIVDFSIDDKWACEAHQIRHPLIDEILYSSSPRDIMARGNPPAAPMLQTSVPLLSSSVPAPAVQTQALPQLPSMESPEYVDPKFRWIHLPTNNMAWVEDLVNNMRQRQQVPAPAISRELWGVDLQSTSPGSAPHTYSITPQCKLLNADAVSMTQEASKQTRPFFICLPYIHWERSQGHENMTRILEGTPLTGIRLPNDTLNNTNRIKLGETVLEDDPSDILLNTYVGKSPPLHIRRTLDQYYYSKLKDTQIRDRDQVVNRARDENLKLQYLAKDESRFPKWVSDVKECERTLLQKRPRMNPAVEGEESSMEELTQAIKYLDRVERRISEALSGANDENIRQALHATLGDSPIIMVDQLWLWVLDDNTVITSFSARRQNEHEPDIADYLKVDPEMRIDPKNRTDILRSISKHLRTVARDPVLTPRDLVNLIVSQCLGILLDHKNRLEELDFLTTFSTQTSSVLDKTAKLLNLFVKTFERYGNKSEIPGDVFETIFSVTKETLLFREVQDIRDELGMLSALFLDQLGVLADAEKVLYQEEVAKNKDLDDQDKFQVEGTPLGLARARVMKHWRDVERMEGQARQAYEMLKDLLDLKQQQANVLEARQSRKQAVIAARQGKVVLVFTVVTIVFLPLTFMTTIFTLNVSTFPREIVPATDILPASTTLNGRYVFPLIVGVTIAMAVPLVFIAFKVDVVSAHISRLPMYRKFFKVQDDED
ncbi:hypothetical protein ONS95_014109 [Cadophora gregata]|uniref:uncharacterized protein n=1 Tax=Cadophora gregata TaxID=51156 RepID=UPI0026DDBFE2|nr:uncharacterized protein ONS95_014109 [Cadophora gregata]KAK0113866.1 hypothetical protein ONS96_014714 [Cadophora gregata f. sp. sojae]KAK0114625.1 hypothetical protein ONS95_014109 [Cadophora gregata]